MSESGSLSADRPDADHEFRVDAPFNPAGDQPEAIEALARGFREGADVQTLLDITGSSKTSTVSWVVEKIQKLTLVLVRNETLTVQLYEELKGLFPDDAIEYFVSYCGYYQPEAYIEQADTCINKDMSINEEVNRLRHSATWSLLTHDDVIVVASMSAIYGLGDPKNYTDVSPRLEVGQGMDRDKLLRALINLNYERNDVDSRQRAFRAHGSTVEVFPMYGRYAVRIEFQGGETGRMLEFDPLEGEAKPSEPAVPVCSTEHCSIPEERLEDVISEIEELMEQRVKHFQRQGNLVTAQHIEERTTFDIEMLRETSHCSGIENYSIHLSGRESGDTSYILLDYFPNDSLTAIDESHVTPPQIKGQYTDSKSRKGSLVKDGFRLPTTYDNRPLIFEGFEETVGQTLFASATPGDYKREHSDQIIEQVIQPTHLAGPKVEVTEATGQVDGLMARIDEHIDRGERMPVMTFTKRVAKDPTEYFEETGIDMAYIHDETGTLERRELIRSLRLGDIDVLAGINLLREDLDIPEISLVAILDVDQQGFLRPETTLVQTIGRATRSASGEVVLCTDEMTDVMEAAISETQCRRHVQQKFSEEHGYTPTTIEKGVGETNLPGSKTGTRGVPGDEPADTDEAVGQMAFLEDRMQEAADNLEFEFTADIRDHIQNLRREFDMDALEDGVASRCPDEHDGEADDGLTPPDEF